MAPRRRFFPSTTVQKVPGRTVELEMQLRPVATAPVPAAAPAPANVTWLPHQSLWDGVEIEPVFLGDGRWGINNGWGIRRSIWEGVPGNLDDVRPELSAEFRCTEIEVVTSYQIKLREYFGVIQGATLVDARWEFEWDPASVDDPSFSRQRHRAWAFGNVIRVLLTSADGGLISRETLTARAYSGGAQVGELKLVAIGKGS